MALGWDESRVESEQEVEQDVTREERFAGNLIRRQELFLSVSVLVVARQSITILHPFHLILHSSSNF